MKPLSYTEFCVWVLASHPIGNCSIYKRWESGPISTWNVFKTAPVCGYVLLVWQHEWLPVLATVTLIFIHTESAAVPI